MALNGGGVEHRARRQDRRRSAGAITLNGVAPTTDPACTSNPSHRKAVVRLTDAKLGYAFDLQVPCSSSTFALSGQVFPGTYASPSPAAATRTCPTSRSSPTARST